MENEAHWLPYHSMMIKNMCNNTFPDDDTSQIIWILAAKKSTSYDETWKMCYFFNIWFDLAVPNVMDYLVGRCVTDDQGKTAKFYECVLCRKQAKDRSNMRRHMIRHHAVPINQPCPFQCGKVFKNKLTFNFHVKGQQCLKKKTAADLPTAPTLSWW